MAGTVTINLAKPITSVKILDNPDGAGSSDRNAVADNTQTKQAGLTEQLESQKTEVSQILQTLQTLAVKLNEFYDNLLAEHKKQIAKLSVEIARKILMQKVQQGDYEIQSIIEQALKKAPTHQDLVVHLNPEDLVQWQKLQADNADSTLAGIKFISDPNIGQAECLLESPKGTVESLIDKHLEQIGNVLKKAE